MELEGEETVNVDGREKFADILIELQKLNANIKEEDIEIVFNTLYMHPNLANTRKIKFLISEAYKSGGAKSLEEQF